MHLAGTCFWAFQQTIYGRVADVMRLLVAYVAWVCLRPSSSVLLYYNVI